VSESTELEFLRFFYAHVDNALGPASDDIYDMLKDQFVRSTGKDLPGGYGRSWDEEEFL
jgi:hypothetical protein